MSKNTQYPWQISTCNVPAWIGGSPAGVCGEKAYGHQLPDLYLYETRSMVRVPYCFGHACPAHGGPRENEVRIFQDGLTPQGRPMWCAVMPDFVDLHESHAGFDGNPVAAAKKLQIATDAALQGEQP